MSNDDREVIVIYPDRSNFFQNDSAAVEEVGEMDKARPIGMVFICSSSMSYDSLRTYCNQRSPKKIPVVDKGIEEVVNSLLNGSFLDFDRIVCITDRNTNPHQKKLSEYGFRVKGVTLR